jgi:uncharacterized protein YndB with AHSA1/START domain
MARIKIDLEYIFRASPIILYQFFTTPSCLVRWFCDEVDINGEMYTFVWNGSGEVAHLEDDIEEERIRFVWQEPEEEGEFLEFRIEISPVTGETILEVTDFCDDDDLEDHKKLWESQIRILRQETGG